ncbi:MAG: hypothetical protein EBS41_07620 [Actinobacteria bacterium]|nr:hypothetical protein [Actinomycetota bacterium]
MALEEAGISQAHAWAQAWRSEDDIIARARTKALDLGCTPVAPHVGALLQTLAAAIAATAVVEVGTGTGVSGTWLLRGMAAHGVLTTIDYEAENQRVARATFAEAAVPPQRTRVITGKARDVLARLTPAIADLISGATTPTGRLPITFPVSTAASPSGFANQAFWPGINCPARCRDDCSANDALNCG